jgi:hypothetical protein
MEKPYASFSKNVKFEVRVWLIEKVDMEEEVSQLDLNELLARDIAYDARGRL